MAGSKYGCSLVMTLEEENNLCVVENSDHLLRRPILSLNNGCLKDHAIVCLARALASNTELRELDLGSNKFGSVGVTALFGALRENTTLTTLDLSDIKVCEASLNDLVTSLTSLTLSNCKMKECGPLASALEKNNTLTSLDISGNDFYDMTPLFEMLKTNTSLKSLTLKNCKLKECGPLASALEHNNTLTSLNVSGNRFQDDTPLFEVLKTNTSLKHFVAIFIGGSTCFQMNALSQNTTLKSVYLVENEGFCTYYRERNEHLQSLVAISEQLGGTFKDCVDFLPRLPSQALLSLEDRFQYPLGVRQEALNRDVLSIVLGYFSCKS